MLRSGVVAGLFIAVAAGSLAVAARQLRRIPQGDARTLIAMQSGDTCAFIAERPRLDRIDVYIRATGRSSAPPVILRVREGSQAAPDRLALTLGRDQVVRSGYYSFAFKPLRNRAGDVFFLSIEGRTFSAPHTDRLAGGAGPAVLPHYDGFAAPTIREETETLSSLPKRLAAGKPTLPGKSAFYQILFAFYLASLGVLGWRLSSTLGVRGAGG